MRFEIRKSDDGQYYWALVAGNNETLGVSETMHNKRDVEEIIQNIARTISRQHRYNNDGVSVIDKTGE